MSQGLLARAIRAVKSALLGKTRNGYRSDSSAITAAAQIAAAGFAKAAQHVRNMSYSEAIAETSGVWALRLKKLPKFFVTLTTRLVGWNGIQSPDSVIKIQRSIADEF